MGARVLIIEDNPDNLELMSYLLRAFGHEVLAAMDGEAGLALARAEAPDLIICDVHLPRKDGYQVARELGEDPALGAIPLVAVTALAMVGDRDRVVAAGFDGYLPKPIDPEAFVQQMEAYLLQRSSGTAPRHQGSSAAKQAGAPSRGQRILVVDNLSVNLELARTILEPFGYEVATACGVASALEALRQETFDLILSDVSMSRGTGFDLIQAIQNNPALKGIPFVFITSTLRDEASRARGLALGAAKFLFRPIEPEKLLAEIAECLPIISK